MSQVIGNAIVVLLVTLHEGGTIGCELHQAGTLVPHDVARLLRQAADDLDQESVPSIALPDGPLPRG